MKRTPLKSLDVNTAYSKEKVIVLDESELFKKNNQSKIKNSQFKLQNSNSSNILRLIILKQFLQLKKINLKIAFKKWALDMKHKNSNLDEKLLIHYESTPKKRRYEIEDVEGDYLSETSSIFSISYTPPRNKQSTPLSKLRSSPMNISQVYMCNTNEDTPNNKENSSDLNEQNFNGKTNFKNPTGINSIGVNKDVTHPSSILKSPKTSSTDETSATEIVTDKGISKSAVNDFLSNGTASSSNNLPSNTSNEASMPSEDERKLPLLDHERSISSPIIIDHNSFRQLIHKKTAASTKTLLKKLFQCPNHSNEGRKRTEVEESLRRYRCNNVQLKNNPMVLDRYGVKVGEDPSQLSSNSDQSIVNYHYGVSDIAPLSPLGDQSTLLVRQLSSRNDIDGWQSPISLVKLSIVQDKLEEWRSKYFLKGSVDRS